MDKKTGGGMPPVDRRQITGVSQVRVLLIDDCVRRTDVNTAGRIGVALAHGTKFGNAERDVLGHRGFGLSIHFIRFAGAVNGVAGAFVNAGVAINAIIRDNDHVRYLSEK